MPWSYVLKHVYQTVFKNSWNIGVVVRVKSWKFTSRELVKLISEEYVLQLDAMKCLKWVLKVV